MQGGTGQPTYYFDVEWLSNFEHERERLFFEVPKGRLRIVDIKTFDNGKIYSNVPYIKVFGLWSALSSGHYLIHLSKKTQRMLTAFIQTYNANNNIQSQGEIVNKSIPIFMQQMFYNLVQKTKKMIVISAQHEKLQIMLKNELFSLANDGEISAVSPFMQRIRDIEIMKEHAWILDAKQIETLRDGQKGKWMHSDSYKQGTVQFRFGIRNNSHDEGMAFRLNY